MNYDNIVLADFEQIFADYTDSFLTGNEKFDSNILLKIEHSLHVQQECRHLAETEGFSTRMAVITEIAGLFHDIGRFEQLKKYNTFVDCKSIDHGDFGYQILEKQDFLSKLSSGDRSVIMQATKLHNKRTIGENHQEDVLKIARAVRDADKLDIMRVLLNEYAKGKLDKTVILHLEESDEISPKVMAHLVKRENPLIADFVTLTDFKLAQLAWIYDLNYMHTKHEFRKRGFYDQIVSYLPDTPEIKAICKDMLTYLNEGM